MKRKRGDGGIYQQKGSTNVWFHYSYRGKIYRESSGSPDPRVAEKMLKNRLKEIGADEIGAQDFIGPDQKKITVSDLLNDLELHLETNKKGKPWTPLAKTKFLSHLKPVRAAFGDWRAIDLTISKINKVKKEWKDKKDSDGTIKGRSDGTINRELGLLRQALLLAVKNKRLTKMPCGIELKSLNNARQGFFEKHEVEALAKHLPADIQDFTRFAFISAWRKTEIATLEWNDLDLPGRFIRLKGANAKNGESRKIALTGELWEIIQRRLAAKDIITPNGITASRLIFHRNGQPIGDFRKAWASACKTAKLEGRIFHDLRRSRVRNLVRAGVGKTTAKEISGHKTDSVFDRYDIQDDEDLKRAAVMVDAYLKKQPSEPEVA